MSLDTLAHWAFDPAALKREFPGLADDGLHYLDNAATAQMPEDVLHALRRFEIEARANVHEGAHRRARAATAALHEARSRVAMFLNAYSPDEVVFTYGTTSSINLLAHSFGASLQTGDEILLSVLEHHSNLVPWQRLAMERGLKLRFLPVTDDGRIDMDKLDLPSGAPTVRGRHTADRRRDRPRRRAAMDAVPRMARHPGARDGPGPPPA